jgi:hypothetical protein
MWKYWPFISGGVLLRVERIDATRAIATSFEDALLTVIDATFSNIFQLMIVAISWLAIATLVWGVGSFFLSAYVMPRYEIF